MIKMTKNITLAIPDDIYVLMKEHPEISWSTIARKSIQAFAKVLGKAEESEEEIAKKYGKEVTSRFSMGISENSNENRYPAEAGMLGYGYNAGVNFNINVQPTRQQAVTKPQVPKKKDILEEATKE